MIKVCDSIMGSGKTSSTINYINEHPNNRIIYITPYLDEAARIKAGCPNANFIEPSDSLPQYSFKKSVHTMALIKQGVNISTTHQAFKMYTPETLDCIKRQGYTLIIDENVEVLEPFEFHPGDLKMVIDAGYVVEDHGIYSLGEAEYKGTALKDLFALLSTRELIRMNDKGGILYYWALPPALLTSFKDVFILTYLFDSQSLYSLMKIYDLPFTYIGISKNGNDYHFSDTTDYVPDYVNDIKNKIHIIEGKLNDIGNERTALSMAWFERGGENIERLKKNISNCYNNVWRGNGNDKKMWGSFNKGYSLLRGKGYSNAFLTFNTKATNKYKDKIYLAYVVNIFMNVSEKKFYAMHGIVVDEDRYALSIMVQWIWRSAIRGGEDIYLYIPSKRMRTILKNWLEEISGKEE